MEDTVVKGEDGKRRCPWGAAPAEYRDYHDGEWGRPLLDETRVFEKVCLEGFQSGLSWLTILRKRENFRRAFAGFDLDAVAAFGDEDIERLLRDAGIVRHRGKIEAAVNNARATVSLHSDGRTLVGTFWAHAPTGRQAVPKRLNDIPATTPASAALAKDLRSAGFRFVGPTTAYAAMQSLGVVNDHLSGCHVRAEVEQLRRGVVPPPR